MSQTCVAFWEGSNAIVVQQKRPPDGDLRKGRRKLLDAVATQIQVATQRELPKACGKGREPSVREVPMLDGAVRVERRPFLAVIALRRNT